MTDDDIYHYRKVVRIHDGLKDPLVTIKTEHLREMLDCWEWYADHKPRVRRQAIKETTP